MGNQPKIKCAFLTTDARVQKGTARIKSPDFGAAPQALLTGMAACQDVELHVVSCSRQPVESPEKLADNIWFHSLLVPKLGWMRTLYQGCIRTVRKKLQEIQPDIVHGQGTELDCAMNAVFSGFPNVITIHGNMRAIAEIYGARLGSFHWLAARLETLALHRSAGVFCNSAYTENLVLPRARKTWRVANALRSDFFSPASKGSARSRPVLLNIGSLLTYKRQRELLAVAGKLWRRGIKFELHFIGDRERQTEYGHAFAVELSAAEKAGYARHLGILSIGELIAVMDNASALIHVPTEEAFGLVVAEGLARNLKFFGSNTGGVPDIARSVEGAELFEAQDWEGLEQSMAQWLTQGCPKPTTAAATMRERFHPEVIARRHLEIYREVLEDKAETKSKRKAENEIKT